MASGMYIFGLREIMQGRIDLVQDDMRALLVTSLYTPNLSAEDYQTDIPEAALLGEVQLVATVLDVTKFKADPVTFLEVPTDQSVAGVVLIKNTDDKATSPLVAYHEVTPFTTDGSDVVVNWDPSGLFEL